MTNKETKWKLNPECDRYHCKCVDCKWFYTDHHLEPCCLCEVNDMINHHDCYFNAEKIDTNVTNVLPNSFTFPSTICIDTKNVEDDFTKATPSIDEVKDKKGKPRMSLILPHAAEALVRIREYGLKKYPDANNWRKVDKADWLDALMRHLMKYLDGEEIDDESGYPHLWHALANLSYMIEGDNNKI